MLHVEDVMALAFAAGMVGLILREWLWGLPEEVAYLITGARRDDD